MNIFFIVIGIAIAVWCIVCNIYTIRVMSAKEMRENFIKGQCFVGKVFANIFYAPAWFFKGIRFVVVATRK